MPSDACTRPTVSAGRPWLARNHASHDSARTASGADAERAFEARLRATQVTAREGDPAAEGEAARPQLARAGAGVVRALVGEEEGLAEAALEVGRPRRHLQGLWTGTEGTGRLEVDRDVGVAAEHGQHAGPFDSGGRAVVERDGLVQEPQRPVGVEARHRDAGRVDQQRRGTDGIAPETGVTGGGQRVGVTAPSERPGRLAVDVGGPGRANRCGERLTHERVREGEARAVLDEQAPADALLQVVEELPGGGVRHAGQHVQIDLGADHRGRAQGGGCGAARPRAPLLDDAADAVGEVVRRVRVGWIPGGGQFHEEERVAAAAGVQLLGTGVPDDGPRRVQVQRVERERHRGAGERHALLRPRGRHHEHALTRQVDGRVRQPARRRGVGEVRVVDDQDDRLPARQAADGPGHGAVEDALAPGGVHERGEGRRPRRGGVRAQQGCQHWRIGPEDGVEATGPGVLRQCGDEIEQGLQREGLAQFVAGDRGHADRGRGKSLRPHAQQPGLPHAGLALDRAQDAAARCGVLEQHIELAQGLLASGKLRPGSRGERLGGARRSLGRAGEPAAQDPGVELLCLGLGAGAEVLGEERAKARVRRERGRGTARAGQRGKE